MQFCPSVYTACKKPLYANNMSCLSAVTFLRLSHLIDIPFVLFALSAKQTSYRGPVRLLCGGGLFRKRRLRSLYVNSAAIYEDTDCNTYRQI